MTQVTVPQAIAQLTDAIERETRADALHKALQALELVRVEHLGEDDVPSDADEDYTRGTRDAFDAAIAALQNLI